MLKVSFLVETPLPSKLSDDWYAIVGCKGFNDFFDYSGWNSSNVS